MAHPQFEAVNLISDPIHGHIELTKRLTPEQSGRAGLAPAPVAGEALPRPPARPLPTRTPANRLSHQDLGQAIIERELGAIIGGLRRAPDLQAERAAFPRGGAIGPTRGGFPLSAA